MPYGLETVHAELYEVLADAVRVLEMHGLPYSLMCGSLLGAVRHQAIIPWDDDVDLVLPRESYDRFEALYPGECGLGFTLDLSDTWVPRVRKLGGSAFIDLFVLDPLPSGRMRRFWKLFRLQTLQGMLKEHPQYRRFSLPKRLLLWGTHMLGKLCHRERILLAYRRIARSGLPGNHVHMSNGSFALLSTAFLPDTFTALTWAPFGPLTVHIPQDAPAVLTRLYGAEYMTPPPEQERRPLHLDR
ncbi:MAG: LicD family protein [Candidatus Limiplasma sp.]|nr:LicD family protein [Candidatus Limiplasma sp.]MEA5145046.1 LicD family protein [Candidatus Limiplasma sp.]